MNAWKHFKTITYHKWLVMRHCFKVGLYRQGLLHDMSKYSPVEFLVGCKYYQGNMSPNNAERMDKGYSSSWLHHKGRNKHHFEYWIDYGLPPGRGMCGMKMPVNYVVEMMCDRVAASKVYQKEKYTDASPYEYFMRGKSVQMIHPESAKLLEEMLLMLKEKGEEETFAYIKHHILKKGQL